MCRFVAYLGKKTIALNEIVSKPNNSLISQSKQAKETKLGLNGDGFGLGWFESEEDRNPGLFKSIQPAWNDQNLEHLASKIKSHCFIGHVRSSTIGDVNTLNCHPFSYPPFLFAHNGTIREFKAIKRQTLSLLSDELFHCVQGQTDSEHFFALLIETLKKNKQAYTLNNLANAFLSAIHTIEGLQKELSPDLFSRINTVITDGQAIMATRYTSRLAETDLSLYYALGDYVDLHDASRTMHSTTAQPGAILIASEPLTDFSEQWHEVPANHLLFVDRQLNITLTPIPPHPEDNTRA